MALRVHGDDGKMPGDWGAPNLEFLRMPDEEILSTVRNIDARMARVEQILPTLATRDEMRAALAEAVAPLATREEMRAAVAEAIAPLATKEELRAAIAPLATREEMVAAIKEEGERSRRYADVLVEDLRDDNRLILEHLITLSARVDALAAGR